MAALGLFLVFLEGLRGQTGRAALFASYGGQRTAIKTLEERDDILDP
jgi:flavorubredoxin